MQVLAAPVKSSLATFSASQQMQTRFLKTFGILEVFLPLAVVYHWPVKEITLSNATCFGSCYLFTQFETFNINSGTTAQMQQLPRDIQLRIIKLVVKAAPRDLMRGLGIRPGKLRLPFSDLPAHTHTHGEGSATVVINLPGFKEYSCQRFILYSSPPGASTGPTDDDMWECCEFSIVNGHPSLPWGCEGGVYQSWTRSCLGGFEEDIYESSF